MTGRSGEGYRDSANALTETNKGVSDGLNDRLCVLSIGKHFS